MTRRELAHIFRAHEGYRVRPYCCSCLAPTALAACICCCSKTNKRLPALPALPFIASTSPTLHPPPSCQSLRLVIKDSKKHPGEKLVMAFAEYTNTYFATEAMDKLQVRGGVAVGGLGQAG